MRKTKSARETEEAIKEYGIREDNVDRLEQYAKEESVGKDISKSPKRKNLLENFLEEGRNTKKRKLERIDKLEDSDVKMEEDLAREFDEKEKAKIIQSPKIPPFMNRVIPPNFTKFPNGVVKKDKDYFLNLYWFDMFENPYKQPGIVFLFGKMKIKSVLLSVCVRVVNIQRHVFLYPKNESVTIDEMEKEILSWNIGASKKWREIEKKYCFEKDGISREKSKYFELFYGAKFPPIEIDKNNKVFSASFGTRNSHIEELLINKKIKGPCWLTMKIEKEMVDSFTKVSFCAKEFICKFDTLKLFEDKIVPGIPPLKCLSLKVKTINRGNEGSKNEIISAHGVFHPFVLINGPTKNIEEGCQSFSIIRKLEKYFKLPATKQRPNRQTKIIYKRNERELIEEIGKQILSFDPDILIGHNFLSYDLDVFLHRSRDCNVGNQFWSSLGRLKRSKFPKLQSGIGGTGDSTYEEKKIVRGRLVCDTYLTSKEYLKEKSYSLKILVKSQLPGECQLEVIENSLYNTRPYFTSEENFTRFIEHGEQLAYLSMKLMFKLSLLPMTKELTNIAGNLWSDTLVGSRAKRIEYLLLHEFSERGFILPDSKFGKKKKFSFKRGKAKYGGGLVLEPKKGLYDTYILLLDFNSLYPSIILEKNLCFTTVERPLEKEDDEEELIRQQQQKKEQEGEGGEEKKKEKKEQFFAEPPAEDHPMFKQSVLPKVLEVLLKRRKIVKRLMAQQRDESQKWLLNIRQLALKLTANSTYGCLGFSHSRFYCQPIAELITRLGRTILQETKEDIEQNLQKSIVYGDTDSVMVLTSETEFNKAYEIGEQIKEHCNRNNKHIEIDIDGLFRRMLLLRKKKYVALVHTKDQYAPNGIKESKEIKGVDMIRRDWCELSQNVSRLCVDEILSGKSSEEIVKAIHDILTNVGNDVKGGKVRLEEFIMTKGLTKPPNQYPDKNSLPHVKVALEMVEKGLPVRSGMRILYLICNSKGDVVGNKLLADRAHSVDEYAKKKDVLFIDYDWYLENQVLPPVSRLCECIEGTSIGQLAECLGLDKKKFHSYDLNFDMFGGNNEEGDYTMMSNVIENENKYDKCDLMPFKCANCENVFDFKNFRKDVFTFIDAELRKDLKPTIKFFDCKTCKSRISTGRIINHMINNIRYQLRLYYQSYHRVIDSGLSTKAPVNNRTNVVSLTKGKGVILGSIVNVESEYSATKLQLHLQFYKSLFDIENIERIIKRRFKKEIDENIKVKNDIDLCIEELKFNNENDIKELEKIKRKVNSYLERCGRCKVDLSKIFFK